MTRGTELSAAIVQRLEAIRIENGYHTDVARVYGFGERKPDKAPMPYILARIAEDEMEEAVGTTVSRAARYEIEGVMPRSASLQDLQLLHYDILRTLGSGQLPHVRPLKNGWPFEESAEYEPDTDGSTTRSVTSSITIRYVEKY
ncbi:hypothetical protein DN824_20520 [Stutzerimonas nosocomialis]|uniref:hypothetical protein n=1 Tax=Stutzerimonas nosocomialis TaxID=1056496 RepID=UPI0011092A7A|nr:hypothetical protein [Stutzerimonas nosocomialis]TLX54869.1 hypothetical protein DN824_20520 [Stutzerimonas nosocomialis]